MNYLEVKYAMRVCDFLVSRAGVTKSLAVHVGILQNVDALHLERRRLMSATLPEVG